jgi:hypothetical protein
MRKTTPRRSSASSSNVELACNYLSRIASSHNWKKAYDSKYFTVQQKALAFSAMKEMLKLYGEKKYSAMSFQELAGEAESYLRRNFAKYMCFDSIGIAGISMP